MGSGRPESPPKGGAGSRRGRPSAPTSLHGDLGQPVCSSESRSPGQRNGGDHGMPARWCSFRRPLCLAPLPSPCPSRDEGFGGRKGWIKEIFLVEAGIWFPSWGSSGRKATHVDQTTGGRVSSWSVVELELSVVAQKKETWRNWTPGSPVFTTHLWWPIFICECVRVCMCVSSHSHGPDTA